MDLLARTLQTARAIYDCPYTTSVSFVAVIVPREIVVCGRVAYPLVLYHLCINRGIGNSRYFRNKARFADVMEVGLRASAGNSKSSV